tara:strand:+ start:30685 stop:30981 length:297 start_codon:yes stop_codon:yes gene_type:complete
LTPNQKGTQTMTCDFKNIENSKEFNSMQALGANELLFIMRIINASNEPLCPEQIVAKVHLNLTIIRFYAKRLYEEGLIEIATLREDGHHYYMKKGLRT